ncbi:transcriptional regulator [Nocardia sp. FDAARGOS_372]|nr:helix-turn-helix transcriptional regulator [Nocardia sp. FDAARGOS_372]PEH78610.1 transcriptional regulator [Nocardia sp. FDAARGOS_372]
MEGHLQRTLGRNVRAIRIARGYSQEAFADVLGHHRTYQGSLERGQRNLSLRAVERLAEQLGVEALTLLSEDMEIDVDVRVRDGRSR